MPAQYTGIMDEHRAVRTAVGIFDVSHMGEFVFRGPGALEVVRRIFTNDPSRLSDGEALYTVMCRAQGGIVDDCVVYRNNADEYMVVVNASNIEKDGAHFREVANGACSIENQSDAVALLAVQGPQAIGTVQGLAERAVADIKSFSSSQMRIAGIAARVSRTGYTGEDGVEIFCAASDAHRLWDAIVDAGKKHNLKLCGLGARDTLRLEAKLCLYGNDIDETTTPYEAGLAWVVKSTADYVGRAALEQQKTAGVKRRLVCLVMLDRGIARHGMSIHTGEGGDAAVGVVTSGTTSPTLGKSIAMGYVPTELAAVGTRVAIDVRGKLLAAEIVKGPFYKRSA